MQVLGSSVKFTHTRVFSLGRVRDGLILHDHVAEHVLVVAVGTTSHATLVNVDVLAIASLNVKTDCSNGGGHTFAHLVLGELIVLKLELLLSLGQSSILLGCGERKLLIQGLVLRLVDSSVDLHVFLLRSRLVLQIVFLLLGLDLDATLLLGDFLPLLFELSV